jgi:hypothetical protein
MKKLSIIMLALALALVFTAPAMAIHVGDPDSPEGSLGVTGSYRFDGEAVDIDGAKADYFDDDFDLSIVLEKGNVKGYVSLEISDRTFAGAAGGSPTGAKDSLGEDASVPKVPVVDNYYIEWTAMDNLTVKFGEYGLGFARGIGTDGAGASNIQLTYMMDALDISATLSKETEGWSGSDDDNDTLVLRVNGKDAGPFTTASVISYSQMNDLPAGADENSYLGVDLALPLGPVDVALEYGANGGDIEGEFYALFVDLAFIENFGLTVNYFQSSDDYVGTYDGNDWSPVIIYGDNINGDMLDTSAIWVEFTYDVNDKLTVGLQALLAAENDAGEEFGTEVDFGLSYKIADNITYKLAYGSYSAGDGVDLDSLYLDDTDPDYDPADNNDDADYTELFHSIVFKF